MCCPGARHRLGDAVRVLPVRPENRLRRPAGQERAIRRQTGIRAARTARDPHAAVDAAIVKTGGRNRYQRTGFEPFYREDQPIVVSRQFRPDQPNLDLPFR